MSNAISCILTYTVKELDPHAKHDQSLKKQVGYRYEGWNTISIQAIKHFFYLNQHKLMLVQQIRYFFRMEIYKLFL